MLSHFFSYKNFVFSMDYLTFQTNLLKYENDDYALSFLTKFVKENQQFLPIIIRQFLLIASKRAKNSSFFINLITQLNNTINISNEILDSIFNLINSDQYSAFPSYFLRLLIISNILTPNQTINKYKSIINDPSYASDNELYLFVYLSHIIYINDQTFYEEKRY